MDSEILHQAIGIGGGVVGGGSLILWVAKRYVAKVDELAKGFYTLAASFDAWKSVNAENKADIKDHERRLAVLEPKVSRAHERLDAISKH